MEEVFLAKVYHSKWDGEECLVRPGKYGELLLPYNEEKYDYRLTGYSGRYARDKMGEKKIMIF